MTDSGPYPPPGGPYQPQGGPFPPPGAQHAPSSFPPPPTGYPAPWQPYTAPPKPRRGRKIVGGAIAAVALIGVGGAIASASRSTPPGSGLSTTPAATTPAVAGASTPDAPSDSPAAAGPAKVGDSITIKGLRDGEMIYLTVVKVAPKATSATPYAEPAAGKRLYGVQVRIQNTGSAVYDDSPTNGAVVIDSDGQQYSADFVYDITAGPSFPAGVKIAPGSKGLGWIVFVVPKTAKIVGFQFAMNSGFGDSAQWSIP